VVQRTLLPHAAPEVPGYELAAVAVPAGHVMGDLYDWYATEDGMRLTIADVMGKGLGAAILAAGVRASLRTLPDRDIVDAMSEAERLLDLDAGPLGSFVTAFHSSLDAATGRLRFVDAGHSLAYVLRADDSWQHLRSAGMPLGMGFGEKRAVGSVALEPGDVFMVCSDGLLDVLDPADPLDHVRRVLRERGLQGAVDEAAALARSIPAGDDVTVVVVRRTS
jgi:serine phosphatase RsbU (regulator of sigma subunit)